MADLIPPVIVTVKADTTGLQTGMKKTTDSLGQLGSAAQKSAGPLSGMIGLLKGAALAYAGVHIVQFAKDSVKAASDLNEAGTAVAQVFGKSTETINTWAENAASGLGLSKLAALDAAKTFGVYGNMAGLAGKANADFSMTLAQTASDFASFYNSTPEEAINAIGSALRGEAEPIRRFGILMDDASLKAEAMKQGIISSTSQALTPQQKVLAANALILAQGGVAMGDFARTSAGLANQQRILAANLENVKAKLGGALLPFVTLATTGLNHLLAAFSSVADKAAEFGQKITEVYMNAGGGMAGFKAMLDNLGKTISDWIEGDGIQSIIAKLTSSRVAFFEGMANAMSGIMEALINALPKIIDFIAGTLLPALIEQLGGIATQLMDSAAKMWESLGTALTKAIPKIVSTLAALLPKIVTLLASMLPRMVESFIKVFDSALTALVKVLPEIIDGVIKLGLAIVDALIKMLPTLINAAITLFLGLVEGLIKALPKIISAIVGAIPKIIDAIVKMLPKLIEGAVKLFLGIVQGITKALPKIIDAAIKLIPAVVKALIDNLPKLVDAGFRILGAIIKGVVDNIPRLIGGLAKQLYDAVIGGLTSMLGGTSKASIKVGASISGLDTSAMNGISIAPSYVGKSVTSASGAVSSGSNLNINAPVTVNTNASPKEISNSIVNAIKFNLPYITTQRLTA